jgi:hypothetical protein
MQFFTHIPLPPLSNFVELFWFYDGYSPGPHSKERLMPEGSIELVINLKQDEARIYDRENLDKYARLPGAVLCGPHSSFFVIDTAQQPSVIGVHFKPGGAFPFFKMPAGEPAQSPRLVGRSVGTSSRIAAGASVGSSYAANEISRS